MNGHTLFLLDSTCSINPTSSPTRSTDHRNRLSRSPPVVKSRPRSLSLALFAPPSISKPPQDISKSFIQPLYDICLAPSILWLSSSPSVEFAEPESTVQSPQPAPTRPCPTASLTHDGGIHASHFYVEEPPKLTESELRTTERLGGSLRLRREEAETKLFPGGPARAWTEERREGKEGWVASLMVVNIFVFAEGEELPGSV